MSRIAAPCRSGIGFQRWTTIGYAILLGLAMPGLQPSSHGAARVMTKAEMAAAVDQLRARILDLSVEYTFVVTEHVDARMVGHEQVIATIKGPKCYILEGSREVAFNGEKTTTHIVVQKAALVSHQRMREASTQGKGFFDMMLLNPPREGASGFEDQSLQSLLRSEISKVRPALEMVDGHECHVIDVPAPQSEKPIFTVWLDAERGFLPLRQCYYGPPNWERIQLEFRIDDAVESEPGLWFAVLGRKRVSAIPGDDIITQDFEQILEVKGWHEGKPSLSINAGVGDELFNLWEHLPDGTRVLDMETRQSSVVGESATEPVGARLPPAQPRDNEPVASSNHESTRSWQWLRPGFLLGLLAAVCIYFWLQLRRRRPV